MISVQLAVVKE